MYLGAHIGIAGGLAKAPANGRRIGGEAIQIFSKSPKMWAGPPTSDEAAGEFRAAVLSEGLRATAVHHGYLANLASPKKATLARSRKAFLDELGRAEKLGVDALIVHPGAHLGTGVDGAVGRVAEGLNEALAKTPGGRVVTLLENMAGQGTTLGAEFRDLARIRDGVVEKARVGVAIDTCHLFAAGHDFRSAEGYGALMDRLEAELGAEHVRAFHFNDAKGELGSHLDRHENIGKGSIGPEGFQHFLADPRWRTRPAYLETPLDKDDADYAAYVRDLSTLKALRDTASGAPR